MFVGVLVFVGVFVKVGVAVAVGVLRSQTGTALLLVVVAVPLL